MNTNSRSRSVSAISFGLSAAAAMATLLVVPGQVWASPRLVQHELATGTTAFAVSAALPHSVGEIAPALEQHSRRGGGGGGGGQAVPRGGSGGGTSGGGSTGGGSSAGGGSAPRGGSSGGNSGGGTSDGGARTRSGSGGSTTGTAGGSGTPTYSKPRDGRPETGTAVARRDGQGGGTTTVVTGGGYYGGFYPWGWGGLGLGGYYGYYDPWDYGDPYGDPYQPSVGYYDRDGSLKLKVTPRQAEVYVDGYFAGAVDDYDGLFQRLQLVPGPHRIEIRLDGYEPLSFDVRIDSGHTVTYKGEMQKRGAPRDTGN